MLADCDLVRILFSYTREQTFCEHEKRKAFSGSNFLLQILSLSGKCAMWVDKTFVFLAWSQIECPDVSQYASHVPNECASVFSAAACVKDSTQHWSTLWMRHHSWGNPWRPAPETMGHTHAGLPAVSDHWSATPSWDITQQQQGWKLQNLETWRECCVTFVQICGARRRTVQIQMRRDRICWSFQPQCKPDGNDKNCSVRHSSLSIGKLEVTHCYRLAHSTA